MRRWVVRLVWVALLGMLVAGCGHRADDPGVAATVNGAPISVAALEARHDLDRLGLPEADIPQVTQLRAEYGAVLSDMIVARLAGQELAKRHLEVTQAELDKAESAVRADYPAGAFEKMFLEEHIDHAQWREALRDRLTLEKFVREVLGAKVHVSVAEAADYYKTHIDAFTLPARIHFLLVQSPKAEALTAALGAWKESGNRQALAGTADVSVEELTVPEGNLAAAWQKALRALKPDAASPVLADQSGNVALILLERQGESVLDPAKAYARAEALVSAAKRERAFDAWLTDALASATIKVHAALLAEGTAGEPREQTEAASAKEQSQASESPAPETTQSAPPTPAAPAEPAKSAESEKAPAPQAEKTEKPEAAQSAALPVESAKAEKAAAGEAAAPPVEATQAAAPETPVPEPAGAPPAAGAQQSETAAAPAGPASEAPAQTPPTPATEAAAGQEVECVAVKASWVLYRVDGGDEQRVYLKPKNPLKIVFSKHLTVRPGTPSEVTFRFKGREQTVEVKKKESRVLEFP